MFKKKINDNNNMRKMLFSLSIILGVTILSLVMFVPVESDAAPTPTQIEYYDSLSERLLLISNAESSRLELYHDDHLTRGGAPTDGTRGKLSFGPVRETSDSPDDMELESLKEKIRNKTITPLEIIVYLELRDGI